MREVERFGFIIIIRLKVSIWRILPQRAMCSECGFILYEGEALRSPQDIMSRYDDRCPECKRMLVFSMDRVSITPCEEEKESRTE